jgi:hypothetical protein
VVASDHRMRRQDSLDVPKSAGELSIPVHRRLESGLELCPLLPAQLVQLGALDGVAAAIEFPIVRVLDPSLHVCLTKQTEELLCELHV